MEVDRDSGIGSEAVGVAAGSVDIRNLIATSVAEFKKQEAPQFGVVSEGEFAGFSEDYRRIQEVEKVLRELSNPERGHDRDDLKKVVTEERAEALEGLVQVRDSARNAVQEIHAGLVEQGLNGIELDKYLNSSVGSGVNAALQERQDALEKADSDIESFNQETIQEITAKQGARFERIEAKLAQLRTDYEGSEAQQHDNRYLLDQHTAPLLAQPDQLFTTETIERIYDVLGFDEGDRKIQELWQKSQGAFKERIEGEQFGEVVERCGRYFYYAGRVKQDCRNAAFVRAFEAATQDWNSEEKENAITTLEWRGRVGDKVELVKRFPEVSKVVEREATAKAEEVLVKAGPALHERVSAQIESVRTKRIATEQKELRMEKFNIQDTYARELYNDELMTTTQECNPASLDRFTDVLSRSGGGLFTGGRFSGDEPGLVLLDKREVEQSLARLDGGLKGKNSKRDGILRQVKGLLPAHTRMDNPQAAIERQISVVEEQKLKTPITFINKILDRTLNRAKIRKIQALGDVRDALSAVDGDIAEIKYTQNNEQYRLVGFQREEQSIRDAHNFLPPFIKSQLLSLERADFSQVAGKVQELKQELWGESPYTTPEEVKNVREEIRRADERLAELEKLAREKVRLSR